MSPGFAFFVVAAYLAVETVLAHTHLASTDRNEILHIRVPGNGNLIFINNVGEGNVVCVVSDGTVEVNGSRRPLSPMEMQERRQMEHLPPDVCGPVAQRYNRPEPNGELGGGSAAYPFAAGMGQNPMRG